MINRQFNAHGSYSLTVEKQVLHIHARGPGNIELINQYHNDLNQVMPLIDTSHSWATIVEFEGIPLTPPDAAQSLSEGMHYARSINWSYAAVVIGDNEFPKAATSFWSDLYLQCGVEYAIFDLKKDAELWLREKLQE